MNSNGTLAARVINQEAIPENKIGDITRQDMGTLENNSGTALDMDILMSNSGIRLMSGTPMDSQIAFLNASLKMKNFQQIQTISTENLCKLKVSN